MFPVPPAQTLIGSLRATQVSNKIQAFTYDFNRDGGLVGAYSTGITIPQFCIFTTLSYRIITGVTGGGGATFSVGYPGNLTGIKSQAAPMAANTIFSAALTGLITSPGYPILFSISIAPLTAGRMVIALEYVEEPGF